MPKLLEVIVTSLEEAQEAAAGGADRLELIRAFDQGGLTPALRVAEQVVVAVQIPVRVMVRENSDMTLGGDAELEVLKSQVRALSALPIAGLVMGFVREHKVDEVTLTRLIEAAPNVPLTFHRAFEYVSHPEAAIRKLKKFPSVDRILIRLGEQFPIANVAELQSKSDPEIKIVVGLGTARHYYAELRQMAALREVHVGRAVRDGETISGKLNSRRVAALKKAFA